MAIKMVGNYIFVGPSQRHYYVASNFTNYFEIGNKSSTGYYLEAKIENNEFVVNGRLFIPSTNDWCDIRNNIPTGGSCVKSVLPNGYRITDSKGEIILELAVQENGLQCIVSGTVYDSSGAKVAEGGADGFDIHRGPAVVGMSGGARGIVIEG